MKRLATILLTQKKMLRADKNTFMLKDIFEIIQFKNSRNISN